MSSCASGTALLIAARMLQLVTQHLRLRANVVVNRIGNALFHTAILCIGMYLPMLDFGDVTELCWMLLGLGD